MDEKFEIRNDELNEVSGGEDESQDILYYCDTCGKVMSYKVANEHKAKGHRVRIFLPPCEE